MEHSIGERSGRGDISPHESPASWSEQNSPWLPSGIFNGFYKNFLSGSVPTRQKLISYQHLKTGDL